jgi:hypothetical protein
MNHTEQTKPVATDGIAALLIAPVVLYTALRCVDVAISCWKTGWESRPFIYISSTGILVFTLYVVGTATGLGWLWKVTKDRFIGWCAFVVASILALYWVGFLTWCVGVLPNR